MRVDQRVGYAVRGVVMPVFVCLRSICNYVTKAGERVVRLALQTVVQNDGKFVDVILLYPRECFKSHCPITSGQI